MKIIPFRIKPSKEEDNYSDVYDFSIKGSDRIAYEIEIEIDSLNDIGITNTKCTCVDCSIKRNEKCKRFVSKHYRCKHIKKAIETLNEFEVKTDFKQENKNE